MKKWVAGFAAVLAFSIAVPVRSQSPAEQGRSPQDARTHMACTTWPAMSGSGSMTGTAAIATV